MLNGFNYCTRLTMFVHSLTARLRSCLSCGSRAIATLLQFYVRRLMSLRFASVYSLCFLTDEGLSQVGVAARENTEPVRDVLCKPLPCRFSTFLSSQVVWALNKASTLLNPTVCSGLVYSLILLVEHMLGYRSTCPHGLVEARPLPSTTRSNVLCFVCAGYFLKKLNTSAGKITDTMTTTQAAHVINCSQSPRKPTNLSIKPSTDLMHCGWRGWHACCG